MPPSRYVRHTGPRCSAFARWSRHDASVRVAAPSGSSVDERVTARCNSDRATTAPSERFTPGWPSARHREPPPVPRRG